MAKSKLFICAALLHPSDDEPTEVIVEPYYVTAINEEQAKILVHRKIPVEAISSLDQVEVLVRPF